MKLVVGLGNPGRKYEQTRHNVGWWVVDHLADVWRFDAWRKDGEALVADGRRGPHRVRLMKPQTYMNLSGAALRPFVRRETWSAASDLLVVADEVQLALGRFRLRASGSAGGHNGLKSIEAAVGSQDYARLRIGIRPEAEHREVGVLSDFVLDAFGRGERARVRELLPQFEGLVDTWVGQGVLAAMNAFNRRPAAPEKPDDAGEPRGKREPPPTD
ncbi:MAG: aminoacyl-tRNA hydrolase [Gemmatimonadaceae bacterium]|nr:aminoacyl-tRNA hydrolase [Gemmatimonadaceae bacterium]